MATNDDKKDDKKTKSGADRLRDAERYVKDPTKMKEHTEKRKKEEKEAKDKAEADKKAKSDKSDKPTQQTL